MIFDRSKGPRRRARAGCRGAFGLAAPMAVPMIALLAGGEAATAGSPPHPREQSPRVEVTVGASGATRTDLPVEVPIDLGRPSRDDDAEGPRAASAIRVVEVDDSGRTIDAHVPHQFDRSPGPGATSGTLVLLLEGTTAADASRSYLVSFDDVEAAETREAPSLVTLVEGLEHEGQESLRIETPSATYLYHALGGGFASLEDPEGLDWLGYRPGGGSAGEYRGIPNLVHPQGYFHPGGTGCTSRVVSRGPLRVRIASEAEGGRWACTWDIFPRFARLTVERAPQPYWFLYEGTPGGSLEPEGDYYALPDGRRRPASERWDRDIPGPEWLYFGDRDSGRVLCLAHHEDDEEVDAYYPMEGNMTVFGFGRSRLDKFLGEVPSRFTIALVEGTGHEAIRRTFVGMVQQVDVTVRPVGPGDGARR